MNKSRIWHLLAAYFGFKVLYTVLDQLVYWQGCLANKAISRRIQRWKKLATFEFEEVGDERLRTRLLGMDIGQLREKLMDGTVTSLQLVHFFANRCYTIGRELNLSAQELFHDALKLAAKRDAEREEAIKKGT